MTNDEREALIEKARVAYAEAWEREDEYLTLNHHPKTGHQRSRAGIVAALAVFEEAHPPTDDETWRKRCAEETIAWADATKRADIAEEHWRAAEDECRAVQSRLDALLAEEVHSKDLRVAASTDDEREYDKDMAVMLSQLVDDEPMWSCVVIAKKLHAAGFRRPVQAEPTDEGTLAKVYDALYGAGYRRADIEDIVNAMQNAGILFRERRPVQAEPTDWSRYIENPVTGEVSLAPEFRAQAEPREVDADPDTAFELGRVAGYDEAMREMQAEPSDAEHIEARTAFRNDPDSDGMTLGEAFSAGWRAALKGGENRG